MLHGWNLWEKCYWEMFSGQGAREQMPFSASAESTRSWTRWYYRSFCLLLGLTKMRIGQSGLIAFVFAIWSG